MSESDLIAFLNARLGEDEALIRRNSDGRGLADGFPDYRTYVDEATGAADEYIEHFGPIRMLREVEAGRRILARHWPDCYGCQYCADGGHSSDRGCADLADLAARWNDHPDYRQEWVP